jgi:hypothetical protein
MNKAGALRELARQFERDTSFTAYTCLAVRAVDREAGADYEAVFFGRGDEKASTEVELWNMLPGKLRDMRVLMLCFAAAMAETGDL